MEILLSNSKNTICDNNVSYINKYKPKTIEETVYNLDFKRVLNGLISMDYLNILLKGDKSVGKTALINCIIHDYYNGSIDINNTENIWNFNCLNEQGINGFRQTLKVFCQTKCSISGKKKLIILDDLDNLNEQNQQIIRSNIDKYSWNINFIGSCRNLNKVIDSLQSRLNILKIPKISVDDLRKILEYVVTCENINIDSDSKQFLLCISDLSINVLLNNLKKLKLLNNQTISYNTVKQVCCQICFNYYDEYFKSLKDGNISKAIDDLMNIYLMGYSFIDMLENLVSYIKFTDYVNKNIKMEVIKYICKYIDIAHSFNDDELELTFFTHDIYKYVM